MLHIKSNITTDSNSLSDSMIQIIKVTVRCFVFETKVLCVQVQSNRRLS